MENETPVNDAETAPIASPEIVTHKTITAEELLSAAPVDAGVTMLNRDGTPRKKPGRKPGQKNGMKAGEVASDETPAAAGAVSPPKTPQEKKAVRLASDQTARAVLNTTVGVMCELVGPEWDFQNQGEADGMRIALAAYIEAKGGGELSPEVAMLLVTSGYALPRFRHPNTREKIGAFFTNALNAFKRIFSR